ncbi:TIGR03032 family protein [Sphingorhabdus sp.]|jgi:uncharacterized protein (TIGR03032 family)|uniref:TIGR03032 family protein n=1 Tax=Sphingorhabdus sp. TaxID=1902408 RepID=UPI003BAE4634|nr:TIGR03032 family protein [Sphingomonadales bacterium]MBK9432739.1 TIGR03032 family protein [Sphingomonadales bacterium]MBL0022483.1 TIGR03032 family protein [Sphingomonadales bacterium]
MAIADPESRPAAFVLTSSRHFSEWLAGTGASLAFSTYQAGKLFFVGVKGDGRLSIFERSLARCMGLGVSVDARSLLVATEYQIHRLDNVLEAASTNSDGYDACFAPHASWITGDLDVHDIGFGADGLPLFINTLFNCIATVSDGFSFKPVWQPPFISRLAAEDRCHLNGMALDGGVARYVTAVSRSDAVDGWRDRRSDGGIVIDVASGELVCHGLSMPHSPRLYQGRLWLLDSGNGQFGSVDLASGKFEPLAFVPGFARGLNFIGKHAVIGLSLPRDNRAFSGLTLDAALTARDTEARCGLAVIDLDSGDMVHWVRIEGVVRELYDVAVLPRTSRPFAIGFKGNEIKRVIAIDD